MGSFPLSSILPNPDRPRCHKQTPAAPSPQPGLGVALLPCTFSDRQSVSLPRNQSLAPCLLTCLFHQGLCPAEDLRKNNKKVIPPYFSKWGLMFWMLSFVAVVQFTSSGSCAFSAILRNNHVPGTSGLTEGRAHNPISGVLTVIRCQVPRHDPAGAGSRAGWASQHRTGAGSWLVAQLLPALCVPLVRNVIDCHLFKPGGSVRVWCDSASQGV